jgi:hypothetical protein
MEQGSATERNNGQDVKPAEQIALFLASAKQRISDRLTQLFDSSRNTERAREMAKDKINQRLKRGRTGGEALSLHLAVVKRALF